MLDTLKKLTEIGAQISGFPDWLKVLLTLWVVFTVGLTLTIVFLPSAPKKKILEGRVLEKLTDDPIDSAIAQIFDRKNPTNPVDHSSTDSTGKFRLLPGNSSDLVLTIQADGFETHREIIGEWPESPTFSLRRVNPVAQPTSTTSPIVERIETPADLKRRMVDSALKVPADISARFRSELAIEGARISKFLGQEDASKLARATDEEHGIYINFSNEDRKYGYGSDLRYGGGLLEVGFSGLDYGFILAMSDVSPQDVLLSTSSFPQWLPESKRAAWDFLWKYRPPSVTADARKDQRKASELVVEGTPIVDRAAVRVGNSYLLRSIRYRDSDLLVAIAVVSQDSQGNICLLWRVLHAFDTPIATGPEPGDH